MEKIVKFGVVKSLMKIIKKSEFGRQNYDKQTKQYLYIFNHIGVLSLFSGYLTRVLYHELSNNIYWKLKEDENNKRY